MKPEYYITTAIAYASGKPHIGNVYEIVLTDYLARFRRRQGYDVRFQTGTDEHGEKVELKAKAAGVTPKKFVDGVAADIKRLWDDMNISYDKFIRTTDEDHERRVGDIFRKLLESGDIYKGTYKGWYCTPCESFWTESQLVDGKCPDCGREVQLAEEEAYFFRMSAYADRLIKYYDEHPEFVLPLSRKNEMLNNFLRPGLQDLCVSRSSFSWGVPVPGDEKHVIYVWLDALSNYLTGVGYECGGRESEEDCARYWPADLHVVGKDIVRFHTIYWPIFLMALGVPLPKQVFGHPWLLQDGGKMSKSRGNTIYSDDLTAVFGRDAVRYYLLTAVPYDNDGNVSWEMVNETVNSELANVYGNLVNRTVAMTNQYLGGVLRDGGVHEPVDDELKAVATAAYEKVREKTDAFKVADAVQEIMAVFRRANKYIDETMPWVLARDESKRERLSTVLYNLAETIVIGSSLLWCAMPEAAEKAAAELGGSLRDFDKLGEFGLLPAGTRVSDKPEILFGRMKQKDMEEKVEKLYAAAKAAAPAAPVAPEGTVSLIDIAKFKEVSLRVGHILTAEKVEKADKLLKFTVDTGSEVRTIVSGIAKFYTPEEMVGKQVVVVANLKPAKLRGIESQGMLLCAVTAEGDVVIVSPEKPVPAGSEVC
ncbi:MAG TPA: methionine--tRNA ligase [Candidatus Limadaptatus stercoripullorum]|uniref:Methionine--tRNA ligase n=1 Tax=Candidatus Limadaptatus stercoripullorum TaxID=2840846 RepID=A0A9D1N8Z6_9FIRM|nr:methionine--tRNA ligase [Candidatus Limadaptatus stercoripullorum]